MIVEKKTNIRKLLSSSPIAADTPTVTLHLTRGTGRKAGGPPGDDVTAASGSTHLPGPPPDDPDSVREGEDVRLKCLADANPKVHTIQWIYQVSR